MRRAQRKHSTQKIGSSLKNEKSNFFRQLFYVVRQLLAIAFLFMVTLARSGAVWRITLGGAIALAAPQAGDVINGNATISTQGNNTFINQTSNKAIIHWESFNISKGERTHFQQPAGGVALNRINPQQGVSQIYGVLTATGKIILINPAGIYFGPGSFVNVGGLIASTSNISNENFLAGNYIFDQPSAYAGSIINEGRIIAKMHGLVALLGTGVDNRGLIQARMGTVVLASGNKFTMSFSGDQLISFTVDESATQAGIDQNGKRLRSGVSNTGKILADGGIIFVTAGAAQGILDNVINMEGVAQARSVHQLNGVIILSGGDEGTVRVAGKLDVSGRGNNQGGTIKVLGKTIDVESPAVLNASGNTGGGKILIGGNAHGAGPEQNADYTFVGSGANIYANGLVVGDGGVVVVWSNKNTLFYGNIFAQGGAQGGNGGWVETSGKNYLEAMGAVNASAPMGTSGMWLLDPANVTITAATTVNGVFSGGNPNTFTTTANDAIVNVATIIASLNGGTAVTILTTPAGSQNGDITVNSPISKTAGGQTSLTLTASSTGTITINQAISSTVGNLAVTLNGANQIILNAAITTLNGAFTATTVGAASSIVRLAGNISTGSGARTFTVPTTSTGSVGTSAAPILTSGTGTMTLTAGAGGAFINNTGNFTLAAPTLNANSPLTVTSTGVLTLPNAAISTGTGNIDLESRGGALSTANTLNTTSGSITLFSSGLLTIADNLTTTGGVFSLTGTGVTQSNAVLVNAGTGNITVNAGTGTLTMGAGSRILTGDAIGSVGIINITANNVALNTTATPAQIGGTGTGVGLANLVILQTGTAGTPIGIAGGPGAFGLSAAESNNIQATNVTIGNSSSGLMTIAAWTPDANFAQGGLLALQTGSGGITQTGALNLTTSLSALTATTTGLLSSNAITTTNQPVSLTGVGITQAGATSISTGTGNITMNAGTGTLTLNATSRLLSGNAGGTAGTINLIGDLMAFNATSQIGGTGAGAGSAQYVIFQPSTSGRTIGVAGGVGNLSLPTATLNLARSTNVRIGNSTAGTITIGTAATTWTPAATFATSLLTLDTAGSILQTATAAINLGARSLILRDASNVLLTNAGNVFTNIAATLTGPMQLTSGNALTVGSFTDDLGVVNGISTSGNVALTSSSTISESGTVFINGAVLTTSSVGGTTLNNANTISGFNATNTGSGNISLINTGALNIAGISQPVGNLTISNAGAITQTGALIVPGIASFAAGGTNDITLGGANDFGTATIISGNNVTLNDINALNLGGAPVSGNLSVTTAGAITQSGVITSTLSKTATFAAGSGNNITLGGANDFKTVVITSGNDVILNDVNSIILGNLTIFGNLNVTTSGDITQSGMIIANGVGKTATFASGATNNITLAGANDFTTVAITNANDVILNDINVLNLGASTISGQLTVTTAGAITQSGPITVAGANETTSFTAGSGNNITLTDANNDFSRLALGSGNDVSITDVNEIVINPSTISGNFTLNTNGSITQNGALIVNGVNKTSTFNSGSSGAIDLSDAANDFTTVAIINALNANVHDVNNLNLGSINVVQDFTAVAGGNLATQALIQTAGGNVNLATTGTGTLTIGASGIKTSLNGVSPGGAITITAANTSDINPIIIVNGVLDTRGGSGGVLVLGGHVQLNQTPLLGVNNITINGQSGDTILGDLIFTVPTLIETLDADIIINGTIVSTGIGSDLTFFADSNSNNTGGIRVTSIGSVNSSGNLTLEGSNLFVNPGVSIELQSGSSLLAAGTISLLGNVGNSDIVLNGNIQSTGVNQAVTVNAAGTGRTELGANITTNGGAINLNDAVTVNASSALSSNGGAINIPNAITSVGQTLTLDAGSGTDITLTNAGNDLGTVAIISGRNVQLFDFNRINLGASTISGNFTLSAGGDITQSGVLSMNGAGTTATFAAGATNSITLNNINNDFTTVAITSGNDVTLRDINALNLGASVISGTLNVFTNGAITQSGALIVNSAGNRANFTAGSGNSITLGGANDFERVAIISGSDVVLNDINALIIGTSTVSGNLSVASIGALTQTGSVTANGVGKVATFAAGAANDISFGNSNDFTTVGVTSGNNVTLNDINALNLAASTISGNLAVTTAGVITQTGALTVLGTSSFSAGANPIDLAANGGSNRFTGAVTLSNSGANDAKINNSIALILGTSNVGRQLTATSSAGITLNGSLSANNPGGNSIILSGTSFNNAGAFSLNPSSGRFLVWSVNPASDNRGGIAYNFKQYNATYGSTTVLGIGNGFLYTIAPVIIPSLTGTVVKSYTGTTDATLMPSNYTFSGAIDSDIVTLNNPTSGTYGSPNVGTSLNVSVSGVNIASATDGSAIVYGYQISPTTLNANIGQITPASLNVTANNANKTYGQTTIFTGSEFTPTGLQNSETIGSVTLNSAGAVSTANVPGSPYAIVASAATGGTFDPANYTISYTDGALTVNPATINVNLTGTVSKVYDTFTAATLAAGNYNLTGVIDGDVVNVTAATSNYNNPNVGTAKNVEVTGLTLGGASAVNYQLASTTTNADIGIITPATLTVLDVIANNKVFDATTAATLNLSSATLSGVLAGDTVGVSQSDYVANFVSMEVGNNISVTVSELGLTGTSAGNYALTMPTGLAANILAGPAPTPIPPAPVPIPPVTPSSAANVITPFNNQPVYASSNVISNIIIINNTSSASVGARYTVANAAAMGLGKAGAGTAVNVGAVTTGVKGTLTSLVSEPSLNINIPRKVYALANQKNATNFIVASSKLSNTFFVLLALLLIIIISRRQTNKEFSFEVRTALTTIIGFSIMFNDAKSKPLTVKEKEYLNEIFLGSRMISEELAKIEMDNLFVSGMLMSFNVRAALTKINGYADLLGRNKAKITAEQRECINEIHNGSNSILQLITVED